MTDLGAIFRVVECEADEDTIRMRFKERKAETDAASDARWGIYKRQKELFEPLDPLDPICGEKIAIKCEGEGERVAREVLQRVLSDE